MKLAEFMLTLDLLQPQQRKFIDDTEKRLNLLFDELNCETVPEDILQGLSALVQGAYDCLISISSQRADNIVHVSQLSEREICKELSIFTFRS